MSEAIPTFITAVPWDQQRVRRVRDLAEQTGATVVWDEDKTALHTWLRALRLVGDGPAILLEDDVRLDPEWRTKSREAIAQRPDDLIRFFGRGTTTPGLIRIPGKDFAWNQAVYYPPGLAAEFLEWLGDRRPKFAVDYHDLYFAKWLHLTGRDFWERCPSLVQHEDWISVVSTGRSTERQSRSFGRSE